MVLTDGHDYFKQLKTFEQMESELILRFFKHRWVDVTRMEPLPKYEKKFYRDLRKMVDYYFGNKKKEYTKYLYGLGLSRDDERIRLETYKSEAARIKAAEYEAKIERRASAQIRPPVVQMGERVLREQEQDVLPHGRKSII